MAQRLATQAELEVIFPSAATLDQALVAEMLALAGTQFDLEIWGDKASYGHELLTAHYLAVAAGLSGAAGGETSVIKRKIDGLEVQYGSTNGTSGENTALTKYGRMYEALRETVLVWPVGGVSF